MEASEDKSLEAMRKALKSIGKERLDEIFKEIKSKKYSGPTIDEYFNSFGNTNPWSDNDVKELLDYILKSYKPLRSKYWQKKSSSQAYTTDQLIENYIQHITNNEEEGNRKDVT